MKNFKTVILFVIVFIIAILLRLINLDKSGGLWYDEATIYSIASAKSILGMFDADFNRCIMFPFYYIIYHFWITIFSNSDIAIRLMSVFFDILSMLTVCLVCREIANKDKKDFTGIAGMLIYALNSSFIYYAQEAKFYTLTFFIVSLITLFWLKFIKNPTLKNLSIFTVLNWFLFFTYTSQILLIIIFWAVTGIYLIKKSSFKYYLYYTLSILPLVLLCLIFSKYFNGNFDAVSFDNSFILLAVQNWFSPILQGLQNNIINYQYFVLSNILNIKFLIFVIIPILFNLTGIFISLKKYSVTRYLFIIPSIYVLIHIILSITTNYTVLVRYTLPVLPIFVIISAIGVSHIKKFITAIYFIICLLVITSPAGAVYIPRPDGYRVLAETLKSNQIKTSYDYVLPIRKDLLDKYFFIEGKRHNLYLLNSDEALETYLTQDEIKGLKSDKSKHKYLKRYIMSNKIPDKLETYINTNFKNNNTLVVLTDKTISMYSNDNLKDIAQSSEYEKYPFQFLRLSKLNNDLITVLSRSMKYKQTIKAKNWEIYIFEP